MSVYSTAMPRCPRLLEQWKFNSICYLRGLSMQNVDFGLESKQLSLPLCLNVVCVFNGLAYQLYQPLLSGVRQFRARPCASQTGSSNSFLSDAGAALLTRELRNQTANDLPTHSSQWSFGTGTSRKQEMPSSSMVWIIVSSGCDFPFHWMPSGEIANSSLNITPTSAKSPTTNRVTESSYEHAFRISGWCRV